MRRRVVALDMPDAQPGHPPTAKPELTWIAPGELLIDEGYQRDLSQASLKLIRRIVEGWDWRRFKPPVVAWTEEGLEVIDGQHTAIAAETHPGIETIPVIVVDAVAQIDRAQAFIGHNRDRVAITAPQMHVAAAAAGDADALEVNRICLAAGVELLRLPPARAVYRPRTTIALSAVKALVRSEDESDATWVLQTLADADLAPISASHIRALQHLITNEDFSPIDRAAAARAIQAHPIKIAMKEAKEHASIHTVPVWRGLAAVWFRAMKKQSKSVSRGLDASSATDKVIDVPKWVPKFLIEEYCDIAILEDEESAASKIRKKKQEVSAT
ncbi:hypothetical protein MMB17_18395 [Methylobacterium organophilum]|uniref:DUF6551 family protein n=1 Tax=Methylobacterium organophilum TaxID=410 RepID=UPI001F13C6B2|nr:DUF6551 family protein [Methylobacterium organophilum]UMY16634.1 hypothetical protein MMB17_18395 [Methylobacterium organophilum]